jgi:hypothetical protein
LFFHGYGLSYTVFKEKHGKLEMGAYVEVEGSDKNGKFMASEIETKVKK